MPKKEVKGLRPTNYSRWHRDTLPRDCYVWDIDWVEARNENGNLKPVALVETIQIENPEKGDETHSVWEGKKNIYYSLTQKLGIPFFVVWHDPQCRKFNVKKYFWKDGKRVKWKHSKFMDESEYVNFLKKVGE